MPKKKVRELPDMNPFEMTSLRIMARLTLADDIDETIIELLRELQLEYDSLYQKNQLLMERVNIDEKTSLLKYNENYLVNIVKAISRYWQSSQKGAMLPISYMRMDLDNFSRINNTWGHDAGDDVLKSVAEVIKTESRPTDYVFRFGGEEFDIVLPVTPLDGATAYAEKMLRSISKLQFRSENGERFKVTASIGLSAFTLDYNNMKMVLSKEILGCYKKVQKEADNACYQAKFDGKNCYRLYNPEVDYPSIMKAYSSRH